MDDTVILFEPGNLDNMSAVIELSIDFITDYYYEDKETHYLKTGLYRKLLDKTETQEQKEKVRRQHFHILSK